MKTFENCLNEAIENKLAGKFEMGKSLPTFKLSHKTLGKDAMLDAVEKIKEKGFKNFTKYTANSSLIYFIHDKKVIAKIFTMKGIDGVTMNFYENK